MPEANRTNGVVKHESLQNPAIVVSTQEVRIRKVLKLIESEPARSIEELAAQCNLSHSHLQHLFKQHTGVQLGHLLLEQRLLKAACLLENSNMSVKEIACAVGYEHTSSFIRAFERRFGIAPRTYRTQADRRKC
jgi:transcriptional regulator GlxA family with amidase domain